MRSMDMKVFTITITAVIMGLLTTLATDTLAGAYEDAVTVDAPVSYWQLNETSGTVAIDAMAANNGTYNSLPAGGGDGQIGAVGPRPASSPIEFLGFDTDNAAPHLNLLDDCVLVPDSATLDITNALTVEAWINPDMDSANGYTKIVTKNNSGHYSWELYQYRYSADNILLRFQVSADGAATTMASTDYIVPDGEWTHVAATFEPGTAIRIYINGAKAAVNTTSIPASIHAGTAEVIIGAYKWGIPIYNEFDGLIDEVAIYDKTLSSSKVTQHYLAGVNDRCVYSDQVKSFSPVSYWQLNETSGTVAIDAMAANNGTYNSLPAGGGDGQIGAAGPRPDSSPTGFLGFNTDNAAPHLNKGNDCVPVPDSATLDITNALTVEAWINPDVDSAKGYTDLVSKRNTDQFSWRLYQYRLNADNILLRFEVSADGNYAAVTMASTGYIVPDGEWTHVAATFEPGTALRIYINGAQAAVNTTSIPASIHAGTAEVIIGAYRLGAGATAIYGEFDGLIDEVAIYDKTLSPSQVLQLYTKALNLPAGTLIVIQ